MSQTHFAQAEPLSEALRLPLGVSWQKLMMWVFIITDGLLFAGFLASYGYARIMSTQWPDQATVFNLTLIAAMTFWHFLAALWLYVIALVTFV